LKVLFRAVARELLPAGAADRPKAGFHVPMPSWLRGELRPFLEDRLSPGRLRRQGVLDAAYVGELVEAHMSGKQDLSRNLWGLLLFSSWFDRYMGGA
jgi:asparagine synthase (glutamine-hydrolysing)